MVFYAHTARRKTEREQIRREKKTHKNSETGETEIDSQKRSDKQAIEKTKNIPLRL